jgi:hypothetical protein
MAGAGSFMPRPPARLTNSSGLASRPLEMSAIRALRA